MESYSQKCKKCEGFGTSNGKAMISKCGTCGSKKLKFIKNQGAKRVLSNLDLRTSLSKVPILVNILF